MLKLLIAGPAHVSSAYQADRLKSLVWHYLSAFAFTLNEKHAVICADDTATGRYAKIWGQKLFLPIFPYSAGIKEDILTQKDRDLIKIRDMKMIAEPDLTKAIIFNHTNECSDIIAELQTRNKDRPPNSSNYINITRVMG